MYILLDKIAYVDMLEPFFVSLASAHHGAGKVHEGRALEATSTDSVGTTVP